MSFLQKLMKSHIDKNKENAVSYAFEAEILRREKRFNLALNNINKALKRDKNNADYYQVRALINLDLGSLKKAKEDLNAAINITPDFNRYYMYREEHGFEMPEDVFPGDGVKPYVEKVVRILKSKI